MIAGGPLITPAQKAELIKQAQALVDEARAKGDVVRFPSPYEFMNNNSLSMSVVGPPWSEMTAYDLNTGVRFRHLRACRASKIW